MCEFCDSCAPMAQELLSQIREQREAQTKCDRVRAQLRLATETLQRKLAQTQKQLVECRQASAPSSSTGGTGGVPHGTSSDAGATPGHGTSTDVGAARRASNETSGHSSTHDASVPRCQSHPHPEQVRSLVAEVVRRRRQSEVDGKELVALQAEVTERDCEKERVARELRELSRKLSQAEALAQDRSQDLATIKATWVSPDVLHRVEQELLKMKAKEATRITDPLDALNTLQRDLEDAASWRKTSMGDAHKKHHLSVQVAELQDQLRRIMQENTRYRSVIVDLEEEAKSLRMACVHSTSSVVQRYDDLRSELRVLREERQETYARISTLEADNQKLLAIHDEGKAQRMESELRNLSVEIERLRHCNAALCSQLFGDKAGHESGDLDASMLLQGQRPMDAAEDEVGNDMHIKTIARLQQKLAHEEDNHLMEMEQLIEKVRQMERSNAARMAPPLAQEQQQEQAQPKAVAPSVTSRIVPNFMPAIRIPSINVKASWSSLMPG
eukprot:GEMP01012364.1.p1 GENE.GEMP01012364.1~~GEMP01012364.1.p1  ORF type:complete len:545 (+),score=146.50 GEMP01012364.1:138-1637(+)